MFKRYAPLLTTVLVLLIFICLIDEDSPSSSRDGHTARKSSKALQTPDPNRPGSAQNRQSHRPRKVKVSPLTVRSITEGDKPAAGGTQYPTRSARFLAQKMGALARLSDEELLRRLSEEERRQLSGYRQQLNLTAPNGHHYICWSPGTNPVIVEAYRRVEQEFGMIAGGPGIQAGQFVGIGHWSATAINGSNQGVQGRPVTVTWSIVPDGTSAPDRDGGDAEGSNLQAWLGSIYGTVSGDPEDQPWFPLFEEAFDNIAAQSGLNFVYEPNDDGQAITNFNSSPAGVVGVRGDIRLSARSVDGDFGVLAFAFSPNHGDVVFDSTDGFFNSTSSNSIRLVNTLTHELGHSNGLAHVCPVNQTKLMEPFLSTAFRGCQFDDTYSFQRQYGDELEVHSGIRDNDTAAKATPISLTPGTTSTWKWLSNDDSSDVDYLRFSGFTGQELTATVIPSDPIAPNDPNVDTYLEGPQNFDGTCSGGTDFDPTTRQNLTLELLDVNGSTVLASSTLAPAGETETIPGFLLPADGDYYLRINGGSDDAAQLYQLDVLAINPLPTPRLQIETTRVIAESNSGGNGAPDPGETILLGVTISNIGDLPASNLSTTLTGPAGFVPFDTTDGTSTLSVSASIELQYLFAPSGNCGDTINLSLAVSDDSGFTDTLVIPLTLGIASSSPLIDENFDASTSLPSGWTQSTSNGGSPWVVSSASADTPPNAAFSAGVSSVGDAFLVSPPREITDSDSTLTFRHSYNLQNGQDGAVLEYSLNSGSSWDDLLQSSATVTGGGYNGTVDNGGRPSDRPSIGGRSAWTGSSGGFINTTIDLPAAWVNETIQLRWRLSHDGRTAGGGWYVDSVNLGGGEIFICDPFRPTLTLSASGNTLSEGDSSSTIDLTLSTPLPLASNVDVTPLISGEADSSDLNSAPSFTLNSGSTSTAFNISAAADATTEGTESITFSLPSDNSGFAAGSPSTATVSIEEQILTATVTLGNLTTVFDGGEQEVTVTTEPVGLSTSVTYDGSATKPTNAGSYAVVATVTEPGYIGNASGTFIIDPANAGVTLGDLTKTYSGSAQGATVTTNPGGLTTTVTYNGSNTPPTDVGTYAVFAEVADPNYTGSASDTLTITPASATVTLEDLMQTYDGSPRSVSATTDPIGLPVEITYNGSTTAPTEGGSYAVEATVTDPNYTGLASGTLEVSISYDIWIETFITPASSPADDLDNDGWTNLSEYVLGTDPTLPDSTPSIVPVIGPSSYELRLPSFTPRPDATVAAQSSTDFDTWTSDGVTETPEGFAISTADAFRFLRISFTLNP